MARAKSLEASMGVISTMDGFSEHNETLADQEEMDRFGNKTRMRRSLNATSVSFFMIIAMSSWAYVLNGASLGLLAAGTVGAIVIFICAAVYYGFIVVSMSEMASMIPLAGGPYHWVAVLAPASSRKLLSYLTGWVLTLSWMLGPAAGSYVVAQMIRTTTTIDVPNANPQAWQTYLITLAVLAVCFLLNTVAVKYLPVFEWAAGIVFFVGFIATVVVYAVMAPKISAPEVFGTFTNGGGWHNTAFAVLTAQVVGLYCLIGADGAAHMAEQCRDASVNVPKGMLTSFAFGAISGFSMLILFCFCYTEQAMTETALYGFAFIGVDLVAIGSAAGAKGLTSIVLLSTILSTNNFTAATSRQLMAFARDGGVPFGSWVSSKFAVFEEHDIEKETSFVKLIMDYDEELAQYTADVIPDDIERAKMNAGDEGYPPIDGCRRRNVGWMKWSAQYLVPRAYSLLMDDGIWSQYRGLPRLMVT